MQPWTGHQDCSLHRVHGESLQHLHCGWLHIHITPVNDHDQSSWLFNWSGIIEIGRAWYLLEIVLWVIGDGLPVVFEVWTRVASAEYVCILLTDGQIELYGHAFSWWCCMRHEILPIYNKTNNENLDEKMSKWTVNKINIRSSEKYCYICHIAQLILKYDSVKCLLTCISLIHELEYSISAIASHSSVCRFPACSSPIPFQVPLFQI